MWQLPIVRVSLYLGGCTGQGWGCPSSFYFGSSWSYESVPWAVLNPARKGGGDSLPGHGNTTQMDRLTNPMPFSSPTDTLKLPLRS